MENAEHYIQRWQRAGLLDDPTVAAIRAFEHNQAPSAGRQWQVFLALILGGILLGAGILLFVASHWDAVSPLTRTLLSLAMLPFFHALAWLVRDRFSGLATALHALGTVSCGAAIALIGQIYNIQEHWPAAILLWALCAATGWFLLRDQFQQILTLALVPAWIVSEWAFRTEPYQGQITYLARILAVLAIVYLTAFLSSRQKAVFGILFAIGAIMLPVCITMVAEGWRSWGMPNRWGFLPLSYRIAALVLIALIAAIGALRQRESLVPSAVIAALTYALPWAQSITTHHSDFGGPNYTDTEPNLLFYALLATASVFLVFWGVRNQAKSLVNYGVVAFAATVLTFYFSNIMDKLNRSLGLILLGVLFLAGGWALEKTRRKLVEGMTHEEATA